MPSNGRKSGGYSLQQSLIEQGVTTRQGLNNHLIHIAATLSVNPLFDIASYRVDKNNPNSVIMG